MDYFVANSENVKSHIRMSYGRESVVIYPPVDTRRFIISPQSSQRDDYFLTVSQMVPYKRIDLIVEAFNRSGRPLVIVGDGPERSRLASKARGNIRFEGWLPQRRVVEAMQRCKAFVFAGEEDFGIVMAEAQACGTPVVALGKGGALEIVEDGLTGVLFNEESVNSLLEALDRLDHTSFDAEVVRTSALRFTHQHFEDKFSDLIRQVASIEKPGFALGQSLPECISPA